MKKRYIITGHGKGLGRAWYDHFKYMEVMGLEVMGVDKQNGYDLRKDFDKVVALSEGADVFINNAYDREIQLKLLNRLHNKVGAMIISGSVAADDLAGEPEDPEYGQFKRDLELRTLSLGSTKQPGACDLLYLKLTGHAYCDHTHILNLTDYWLSNRKMFFVQFPNVKDITN
jgi:hypothetical protein